MLFDWTYLVYVAPALILSIWASARVNSAYSKYSKVPMRRGYTGADVARKVLDMNGLYDVKIERTSGKLSDHYDPRSRVIRLSDAVYSGSDTASAGVAAHEAGHAVQHAEKYFPLELRSAIIPITNFGSQLAIPLIFIGILFGNSSLYILAYIGIVLFSLTVLFQLVTLPVEFNASKRALNVLEEGMLDREEICGARKVLSAAALTYVAALAVSVMQLLRLITIVGGNNRRRR